MEGSLCSLAGGSGDLFLFTCTQLRLRWKGAASQAPTASPLSALSEAQKTQKCSQRDTSEAAPRELATRSAFRRLACFAFSTALQKLFVGFIGKPYSAFKEGCAWRENIIAAGKRHAIRRLCFHHLGSSGISQSSRKGVKSSLHHDFPWKHREGTVTWLTHLKIRPRSV